MKRWEFISMVPNVVLNQGCNILPPSEQLVRQPAKHAPLNALGKRSQCSLPFGVICGNLVVRKHSHRSPKDIGCLRGSDPFESPQGILTVAASLISKISMQPIAIRFHDKPANGVEPTLPEGERVEVIRIEMLHEAFHR
jgi:hypothetical protein